MRSVVLGVRTGTARAQQVIYRAFIARTLMFGVVRSGIQKPLTYYDVPL